jgi:hypothetical protein
MNKLVVAKVEKIARKVKDDLRQSGFVIPVNNRDGSISVDNYKIVKDKSGFYSIRDRDNDVIIKQINLPQTAAVLANKLALGRGIDTEILLDDREYGYNLFEELLSKQISEASIVKKDYDRADLMSVKLRIASYKKTEAKKKISYSFEKLRKLL